MPLVPTRLLIIHRQLDFAVTVKKSLEQIGGFEVAPFTASDTALDYIRTRPHDIALVDFSLRGTPGVEVIAKLRALQPDIAIIATPKNAETMGAMRDFALQEVIDTPIPVRQLGPILNRAVQRARETLLPDTAEAPLLIDSQNIKIMPPELSPVQQALDTLETSDYGTETIEVDMSDLDRDSPSDAVRRVISAFEALAAEEPPVPGVEAGGTIRDLRDSLLDSGERVVVELLNVNQPLGDAQPLPPDDGENPAEPALARMILEGTLDHTSPLKPLIEQVAPESPSLEVAAIMDEAEAEAAPDVEAIAETETDFEITPSAPESLRLPTDLTEAARLAQMAVDLTQASLESTAEATLISIQGEVIAHAGKLAQEDIDYLKERFAGEWASEQSQSRIRFINLPGSGKDYMLFSRRTEGDFVLTMVFAGNMPLRVIRRQSDKLLAALAAVPESATGESIAPAVDHDDDPTPAATETASPAAVVPVYSGALMPYTFIWLLRDPAQTIPDHVAQAIVAGLDLYFSQQGWQTSTLRVHEDYIYLFGQLPAESSASDLIASLKQHSAQLVASKIPELASEKLWADSYYALMPGRELNVEEIQRFIRFGRMR